MIDTNKTERNSIGKSSAEKSPLRRQTGLHVSEKVSKALLRKSTKGLHLLDGDANGLPPAALKRLATRRVNKNVSYEAPQPMKDWMMEN